MKIRVFGFGPDVVALPQAMKATNGTEVFPVLQANNGNTVDRKCLIRAAATTMPVKFDGTTQNWFAGMVLRARDAKSYNYLKTEDGKLVLTAEQLGENKIAEVSYFLAHPTTGKGLIASYHGSPGIPTLDSVFRKLFAKAVKERRKAELEIVGKDQEKREAIYIRYKGNLELTQLMRGENIRAILKEFKRLCTVELKFSVVKNTGGYLTKLRTKAVTETEKFSFPPDMELDDELADEIVADVEHDDLNETVIEGTDTAGNKRKVSSEMARNKLLFAEEEYDSLMSNLELKLDDWAPTIASSPVVAWLVKLTANAHTRALLTT